MKKRVLSIFLAVILTFSLLPAVALADGSAPTVDGTILYANGTALIFEGSDNQTRIYIDADRDGVRDDGEERFYPNSQKNQNGDNLYGWTIFGGSKADYTGDTKLTFLGGGVLDVYGGCNGYTLTGNTEIIILGKSTVKGSVYGGSYNTTAAPGVKGNTHVVLGVDETNMAAVVIGNVYGGGNQSSVCDNPDTTEVVEGNTVVELKSIGAQAANVFGGGYGKYAVVEGNTSITSCGRILTKNTAEEIVFGGIYGGGYDPSASDTAEENSVFPVVKGTAIITMTGGWADKIVAAGTCAAYENDHNCDVNLLPKLTVSGAAITVSGGTVRSGIDAASRVTNTTNDLVITGGSIAGNITVAEGRKVSNGSLAVYKTTLDLSELLAASEQGKETEITSFALELSSGEYGKDSIVTDNGGKLYFYLPAGYTAVARYKGVNYAVNDVKTDGSSVFERFTIDTDNKAIYANMNPIKLVSGSDAGFMNILFDANADTEIDNTEMLKIGDTDPTAAGYDLKDYTIYLGFKNFAGQYTTMLSMDGGVVKQINLNGSGDMTKYGVEAVVSGGTVLDGINLGYTQGDSGSKTLTISGGSINAATSCPAIKDGSNIDLYQSTLKLPVSAITSISGLTLKKGEGAALADINYGLTDIYTTANGQLTFWLPADVIEENPVSTSYTAIYNNEPEYTAYVKNGAAPYVFRQTSDPLTVENSRAVKAAFDASSVTYTVTNNPVPEPVANGLKVYDYDAETGTYTQNTLTASISGNTLTISSSGAIAKGDYYVTVIVNDAAGTPKWESDYLKLTVADIEPELDTSSSTLYTNTLDIQITADANGTYACVDTNGNDIFEETEFITVEGGTDKLDITGYDINALGAKAFVSAGAIGTLTASEAAIDGGSIREISANAIKNTSGADLFKATITLSGVSGAAKVSAVNVAGYDVTGVYTDGGKLYFWLPADTEISSVTANSTYTGTLTVSAINTNAASFTAPSSGGTGGGGGASSLKSYTVTAADGISVDPKKAKEGDTVTLTLEKGFVPVVTTASDKTVEVDGDSLTFTFIMPAENVTVTAKEIEKPDAAANYTDLDFDEWYMDAVRFCIEKGYILGVSDTEFDPEGETTREQFITVLWRMCGSPKAGKQSSFVDVPRDRWYSDAIDWAEETGVTNGIGNGSFGLGQAVTREQIATLLYRASGIIDIAGKETERTFEDFNDADDISAYAREGMQFCISKGIINGANGALMPLSDTTRVQFAQIVFNICNH